MAPVAAPIQERRKFSRADGPEEFGIRLVQPDGAIPATSVNLSEGGLCVRLENRLEVRAIVRLQVIPGGGVRRSQRPVECAGRVAWIVQRMDLRATPPFLFDVGIEFVDPPPFLRQFLSQRGGHLEAIKPRAARAKALEPATIRGRQFLPRLERELSHPTRWHLVVSVDDTPCFSGHYPSERAAVADWARFKRRQARR